MSNSQPGCAGGYMAVPVDISGLETFSLLPERGSAEENALFTPEGMVDAPCNFIMVAYRKFGTPERREVNAYFVHSLSFMIQDPWSVFAGMFPAVYEVFMEAFSSGDDCRTASLSASLAGEHDARTSAVLVAAAPAMMAQLAAVPAKCLQNEESLREWLNRREDMRAGLRKFHERRQAAGRG